MDSGLTSSFSAMVSLISFFSGVGDADGEDEDSEAGGRSVSSVRSILAVGVDSAASGSDDVSSFDPAPKKLFTLPEIPISM